MLGVPQALIHGPVQSPAAVNRLAQQIDDHWTCDRALTLNRRTQVRMPRRSLDEARRHGPLAANGGRRSLAWVAGLIVLGVITHFGWFQGGIRTAGDWGYLSADSLRALLEAPQAWDGAVAFGRPNEALSGIPYQLAMGGLAALGASFAIVERVVFFFPFAVLPLLGMFWLADRFTSSNVGRATAAIVFGLNTYILVIGTNQLTVAMAYAIAPVAIAMFLDALDPRRARGFGKALLAGLVLALATAYDPRIGYLIAWALVVLATTSAIASRAVRRSMGALLIALATTAGLHLYWVLPAIGGSFGSSISNLLPHDPWVSWANVVHAVALNHPFWNGGEPEPFVVQDPVLPLLGLPIVAAGAFVLPQVRRDWRLVAVGVLTITGVFCVKGENAPLGSVYGWAFDTLPGFRLYRDMSKFNLYVAIGYALLSGVVASWATATVGRALRDPVRRRRAPTLVAVPALVLLALAVGFSAWPAVTQRLGWTLADSDVPVGYERFEKLLRADDRFGRVLWLPTTTRFTTQTDTHPSVQAPELLERLGRSSRSVIYSELAVAVNSRAFAQAARSLGIRYIAIDRVAEPWAWEAAGVSDEDAGRAAIQAWVNRDPVLVRLISTPQLDVFRVRGHVGYAEFLTPVSSWSVDERNSRTPGFVTVEREALRQSLALWRASNTSADGVIALPAASARIADGELISRPFRVERLSTFRIRWNDARPAAGDTLAVLSARGDVVWTSAAASDERLTLKGPATYRLAVRSPSIDADLVADGSFEKGVWGPAGDALKYDNSSLARTTIKAMASLEARSGLRSLRLQAHHHIAGVGSPDIPIRVGEVAVVRFAWRSLEGPPPRYAPWLGEDVPARWTELTGGPGWNEYVDTFTVRPGAEDMAILFYAGPGGEKTPTAALFDDVEVAAIPRWVAELRLDPATPQARVRAVTEQDLRRISGTFTEPGTYMLRVTSNFDAGWNATFRLQPRGGQASEINAQHVSTTDGMNAWLVRVPAPARVEATLSYQPQRWVTAGATGSLLVLVALFLGYLYGRTRS